MPNDTNPIVLVADDEPSMVAMLSSHLRSKGFSVLEASDGDQAWELAQEHLPNLVLLDVMMPGMSGWEVCRKIRQDASLAHTGVLMLTGIGESLNETTSPLFGADEYIDKPFDFEALDQKVVSVLLKRAAQREAVPRHVDNGAGGPAKAASPARSKGKRSAKKAKPAAVRAKRKYKGSAKAEKGNRTMAAKKGAKKAKKAKKGAKKGKKK